MSVLPSDVREEAFLFGRDDARLVGIVTEPITSTSASAQAARVGVLVVVGGPQYRVGAHRQFVLLARALAARGFATMRFDCAGMGDSDGEARPFSDREGDIAAAIDAFVARVPTVTAIAIWALCDGASAALMYAPNDPRVRQLVLLNPWVRSEAGLARTHLKHYYLRRLVDPTFWKGLVAGSIGPMRALRGLLATVAASRGRFDDAAGDAAGAEGGDGDFRVRMARGWRAFTGDILLVLSGDDLTAREFVDHAARDAAWTGLVDDPRVARCGVADADHTFSRAAWRDRVAELTADWLSGRADGNPSPDRRRAARPDPSGRARATA